VTGIKVLLVPLPYDKTALEGRVMIPPFDVFSTANNGPVWIGAAESLVQALQIARKKGTGSYFVFSLQTGCKTMYEVDATGAIRPAQGK